MIISSLMLRTEVISRAYEDTAQLSNNPIRSQLRYRIVSETKLIP